MGKSQLSERVERDSIVRMLYFSAPRETIDVQGCVFETIERYGPHVEQYKFMNWYLMKVGELIIW